MKKKSHIIRLSLIGIFFCGLFLALAYRTLELSVWKRSFLQGQGNARSLRIQEIQAYRGMITDRNGNTLAVSTPVQSVWIHPKAFFATPEQQKALAKAVSLPLPTLTALLKKHASREFFYLKRQLPPEKAQEIADLRIPGVHFQQEYKRYYPEAESSAQLLGFTNIDDIGIEGLELAYQDWLMGIPGKKNVVKDRTGRVIEEMGMRKEPKPGKDIVVSIDRRIQYYTYMELKNTIEQFSAKSGSVVVLDSATGEILAITNYPSYNPNIRAHYPLETYRNKAITDAFEPGSVIKPFSIASALSTGLFTPTTIIDTRPSVMMVSGSIVRDIHNYGVLNVTGVLEHSSNVGVSKMVLQSPKEQLLGLFSRLGFGQRTETGYPGETDGFVVNAKDVNPFVLATMSFGYGISVSALQLAKAYAIFANQGVLVPISLLHTLTRAQGVRVLPPQTAKQMLTMMESVLVEGTGKAARVAGYRVAGKTGTARIAGKKGYDEHRHIASFVGIAPVSHPRLVVVVIIQEPTKKGYYGAAVAAPLFAKVMSYSLRILHISPDQ